MKKIVFIFIVFSVVTVFFSGCRKHKDEEKKDSANILPSNFKVDIPAAISYSGAVKSVTKSGNDTVLDGNEIYQHLRFFINVGEGSADIIQELIFAISRYNINKPMVLSFQGDDDSRIKNLLVLEQVAYNREAFEFMMVITDALNESNSDKGLAVQLVWNRSPIKGVAILKPKNIDVRTAAQWNDAILKIEYSEARDKGYDSYMIVTISAIPLTNDPYTMSSLKMFAGKTGDYIDVYGNSNHPNARFLSSDSSGFNWAFVATGKESSNIGVAEVGLPPSYLDNTSRNTLLNTYSIKNVFTNEINTFFGGTVDSATLAKYLKNADAPGYFDAGGFVSGGTSPGSAYNELIPRLSFLTPYNPKELSTLSIALY